MEPQDRWSTKGKAREVGDSHSSCVNRYRTLRALGFSYPRYPGVPLRSTPGFMGRTDLLPVIFTTANLWGSDVDLSKAELESGKSDLTGSRFEKLPWLWYHYHLSPGLKHSSSPDWRHTDLGELMESEYIRSIAIVSPSGIESFLKHVSWLDIRS